MATATKNRHTPEDLLAINDRPMPELINGQLVERETGQKADSVTANICWLLGRYAVQKREGLVNGPQCGYQIFANDPEKVRVPSASFTLEERLPRGQEADGHATVRPDLVVEVVLPHSHQQFIREKSQEFLDAGVSWAWEIYADDR